jgi:predicted Rossmann-fold nucleotide-binding protein
LGELRNGLVVGAAEGVIAIGGSWGTLSELALAKRLGLPVVSVGGWSVVDSAGSEVAVDQAISADAAVARLVELL